MGWHQTFLLVVFAIIAGILIGGAVWVRTTFALWLSRDELADDRETW